MGRLLAPADLLLVGDERNGKKILRHNVLEHGRYIRNASLEADALDTRKKVGKLSGGC